MKFVLVQNNNVILGPIFWNFNMFQSVIKDELEIEFSIPRNNSSYIEIDNITKIYPITSEKIPNYNSKIEQLAGPFWSFDDINFTATLEYTVTNRELDAVKNELKAIVADNRWKKEVSGITLNIQSQDIFVTTQRGERDIFLQALQLGSDNKTWKFNDKWLTLPLSDLQTIVTAVITHIQTVFDWESLKVAEIDTCTTLEDLNNIDINYPE